MRQLLPKVLQPTENPLKLLVVGGKSFPKNYEKNIFIYIIFWENFSRKFHLPSCSLSCGSCSQRCSNPLKIHWSCWQWRRKVFRNVWKNNFRYIFCRFFSGIYFCLPSCSLSCGSCSERCSNPLKIHWSCWWWRKMFPINHEKNILYIFFEKIFRENFTYLAAPYRAAAAPKGAPTHWKSTEAAGGGRKTFSKNYEKIFSDKYFSEKIFRDGKFHLPSCSLSCGSCSQRCSNPLKIHWSCWWCEGKVFRILGIIIFS